MHTLEKDPRDARGILIQTTPLEHQVLIREAIGNSFRVEQLLSGMLKQECTDILEARPQQNSGKTPNRDTVQLFSRRPQAVALAGYQMIREEWCFGRGRPGNENNICGLKPFFRIRR